MQAREFSGTSGPYEVTGFIFQTDLCCHIWMLMDTFVNSPRLYSFGKGIFNILTEKSELSRTSRYLFKKVEQTVGVEGF